MSSTSPHPESRILTRRKLMGAFGGFLSLLHLRSDAPDIAAQPRDTPLLVDPVQLAAEIESSAAELRILDASPLRSYRITHIPDATHVFWEDTVDANYPVFGAVVTQGFEQQQRLDVVKRWGVTPDRRIVVYDRDAGFRAARVVWFLRFLGFPEVAFLNGGITAWQNARGEVESGENQPPDVEATVSPIDGFYVVTEALRERIEAANSQIVDIRTDEERSDTLGGQLPLGEIPGSVRLPWNQMIDESTKSLLPRETLLAQTQTAGLTGDRDIIVVGRFGVETALSWLVLREIGYKRVLTYDRGWVEWASTPGLPIDSLSA